MFKPATCHPDRPHRARGLCRQCYGAAWEEKRLTNIRPSAKHGHAGANYLQRTPEYKAWDAMRYRCHVPTAKCFNLYGGRGIKVCDRWRFSFPNFFADVGPRPSSKHSLGRINNDGHYEPGNVRWETLVQQHRNTRRTRCLTWNGRTHTIADWAERTGIDRNLIYKRLNQGWSIERALTERPQIRQRPPKSLSKAS